MPEPALHVRHLSDVPILDALARSSLPQACVFSLALHSVVSSSTVRVGYTECVLRVGIKPTILLLFLKAH